MSDNTGVSNWYQALQNQVQSVLSARLQGNFTPLQTTNNLFYWNWWNANSNPAAFNMQTYDVISGAGQTGSYPGTVSVLGSNSFPLAYLQLVNQIQFQLSKADNQAFSNAQQNAAQYESKLIADYQATYGQITATQYTAATTALGWTVSQPFDYIISYMLGYVWAGTNKTLSWITMQQAQNLQALLPNTPPSGTPVINDVVQYLNAMGPGVSYQNQINNGQYIVNQIVKNLQATNLPTDAAGMVTFDPLGTTPNTYYPSYQLGETNQAIYNDLTNTGSSIQMSLSITEVNESEYQVSFNGGAQVSLGGPFVTCDVSEQVSYNMTTIQGSGTSIGISVTYPGPSIFTVQPEAWGGVVGSSSAGWWYPMLIQEAYANYQAGSSASTGFNFITTPQYNLGSLSAGGNFGQLMQMVISNFPTIVINYSQGDYSLFSQQFQESTSASVSIFGIPIGGASSSFYSAQLHQGASNTQFSVTFTPPSTANVGVFQATANILGGVVTTTPTSSPSFVEAVVSADVSRRVLSSEEVAV